MSNMSNTSFQKYTNLQECQNFLILDVIGIIWYEWNQRIGLIQYIRMELYCKVGIIIPWNHTKEMESYHGIIPWKWNHTMGSYQGNGIIPWDHTKEMESYHGIIPRPWNHTKSMESYHWDHTMEIESYHGHGIIPYHAPRFSYNIYISKQVYSK